MDKQNEPHADTAASAPEENREPSRDEIAALAQSIYEEEGCPHGRAEAHWHEAERRLREQSAGQVVAGPRARTLVSE
jgi:hypothetical protein